MKIALLLVTLAALVSAGPGCECCGPEGPEYTRTTSETGCYAAADRCSSIVKHLAAGADIKIRCKRSGFFNVGECFIPMPAASPQRITMPCEADEGCNAERGPQAAMTVRVTQCYTDTAHSSVAREYKPYEDLKIWCQLDDHYLTDSHCWARRGDIPAKSSTVPPCGSWRPPK